MPKFLVDISRVWVRILLIVHNGFLSIASPIPSFPIFALQWVFSTCTVQDTSSSVSIDQSPSSVPKRSMISTLVIPMVSRRRCSRFERTTLDSIQCFRFNRFQAFVATCYPPSTLWKSLSASFLPLCPSRCKWAPHGNVFVTSCISLGLYCTCMTGMGRSYLLDAPQ